MSWDCTSAIICDIEPEIPTKFGPNSDTTFGLVSAQIGTKIATFKLDFWRLRAIDRGGHVHRISGEVDHKTGMSKAELAETLKFLTASYFPCNDISSTQCPRADCAAS